jgi:hydrogenase nickel incorporation protein HypB
MTQRVAVVERITKVNDQIAEANRARLEQAGVFGLNIMASPGAGKTSLIERTLPRLTERFRVGVIDGDIATSLDAERAAAAGAVSVQINTGGACHLDANMIAQALGSLPLEEIDLLIVENVGNLICPTGFQLGTHRNVLVSSVPEGDDKPYKYPSSFSRMDVLLLNKIDLLEVCDFDLARFRHGVEVINGQLAFFPLSCRTGEGLEAWVDWVVSQVEGARAGR